MPVSNPKLQDVADQYNDLRDRVLRNPVQSLSPALTSVLFGDGTVAAPAVVFETDLASGRYRIGANNIGESIAGALVFDWNATRLNLASAYILAWNGDTQLLRTAADTLSQQRGANAQAFRIYNTLSGGNGDWFAVDWNVSGNEAALTTNKIGTGTARSIIIAPNNIRKWVFDTSSGLSGVAGNTFGVGPNALITATAPTISSGFGTSPSIVANNGSAAFTVNVGTGGTASTGVIGLPTAATGWICMISDQTTPAGNLTRQTANTTTTVSVTNYNTSGVATAWPASDVLVCHCLSF